MVPARVEHVVDGERQVVLVQLDEGRAQLFAATKSPGANVIKLLFSSSVTEG